MVKFVNDLDTQISTIDGERELPYQYTILGNRQGKSQPSSVIVDLWIEFDRFKGNVADTNFIVSHPSDIVPNAQALDALVPGMLRQDDGVVSIQRLTHGCFWIGDENDYPIETDVIPLGNIELPFEQVFRGNEDDIATPYPNILLKNLPTLFSSLLSDPTSLPPGATVNFGLNNIYTGSIPLDIPDPLEPVKPSITLRVDMSNLPNLSRGKVWMGTVNAIPPIITIDGVPPFIHVDGDLNWDLRGGLIPPLGGPSYAVPKEFGLDPGTIMIGSYADPGEITTTGLSQGKMFIGDTSNRIVQTGLPDGHIFIGNNFNQIQNTGLPEGNIFWGDIEGKIVFTGLNAHQLFGGDPSNSGKIIKLTVLDFENLPNLNNTFIITGDASNRPVAQQQFIYDNFPDLNHARILMGNLGNRPAMQGLDAKELFTGHASGSGDIITTVVLDMDNLPSIPFGDLLTGNTLDRPITVTQIAVLNLPPLTFNKVWVGNASNRPEEADITWSPDDATYVLRTAHSGLPNAQALDGLANGMAFVNDGLVGTRTISSGTGISITNGDGIAGDPTISLDTIGIESTAAYATVTRDAYGRVTALIDNGATISTIESDITALQGDVFTLQGQVTTLEGTVAGLVTDVAAIDATLYTPVIGVVDVLALTAAGLATITIKVDQHDIEINDPLTGLVARMNFITSSLLGGATIQAKAILQTANEVFPNAQALDELGTGGALRCDDAGVISIDPNLTGFAALPGGGIIVRIGTGNYGLRTLEVGDGLSINNADGLADNPQINLAPDIANIELMHGSGNGLVARHESFGGFGLYAPTSIVGGRNIRVDNGDASGGNPTISLEEDWALVSSNTILVPGGKYITNSSSQIIFTLPTTARIGDTFEIKGESFGGWKIVQNSGQIIGFSGIYTTSGTSGYVEATTYSAGVFIVCVFTDEFFSIKSAVDQIDLF